MSNAVTISLPSDLDASEFEINMIVAAKLYELGKLSSGQAAEMVGLSKREFLESLGKYKVSVFGYDDSELKDDLSRL
jgi:predicted HTH domain antitoxin